MSLPPLLKHIYNFGTDEVIRRGKRIFHTGGVQMQDVDHLVQQARFRVRNDQYQNQYTVTVNKWTDPKLLSVRCACPYNLGDICRHEVAALLHLNELVQSGRLRAEDARYDQTATTIRMRQVTAEGLALFSSPDAMLWAEKASDKGVKKVQIVAEKVTATVMEDKVAYPVTLRQNEERYFLTTCTCAEETHPLCRHKAALFLHLIKKEGAQFFAKLQNWDAHKAKLLQLYGYTLQDDLTGKFEWAYQDGRPILKVLDPAIKKVAAPLVQKAQMPATTPSGRKPDREVAEEAEVPDESRRLALLFAPESLYTAVDVSLVEGADREEEADRDEKLRRLELQRYVAPEDFDPADRDLIGTVRKLSAEEVGRFLRKTLPFGDFLEEDASTLLSANAEPGIREAVWEYLLPKYTALFARYQDHPYIYRTTKPGNAAPQFADLQKVHLSEEPAAPAVFATATEEGGAQLQLRWRFEGIYIDADAVERLSPGLLLYLDAFYALPSAGAAMAVEAFPQDGFLEISAEDWPQYLAEKVLPWRASMPVHFPQELTREVTNVKPGWRLYLEERDETLLLKPAFVYGTKEIAWGASGDMVEAAGGKVAITVRSGRDEEAFLALLRNLHSDIKEAQKSNFFYLTSEAVLQDNWVFRCLEALRESHVEVVGYEGLRKLRVNTHRPETTLRVGSGIDWFDAEMDVTFGGQHASVADIKTALAARQKYVPLPDGSLGMLPKEWIQRYGLLVKMGEKSGTALRLKKTHFTALDDLLKDADGFTVQSELEEKKEKLAQIIDQGTVSETLLPKTLQATLRPYQQAGFEWINFLRGAGWGGILADDMGLGKTVQALTYFLYRKEEEPEARFLVVCPTTLVYNWESEIRKFAPSLTHLIHHGPKRAATAAALEEADIVITTYGTMRSDIRMIRTTTFDTIVLDESQAIKNPQSQVAKASLLLQGLHKLALSGTPVQNNTFDLYSQMAFLNPGLLGSRESFMNDFATPIDKFGEDEVKEQLRRLTYPFMLRRTKEQVAADLPEKTEIVLWCEMGDEQRRIYDAYRSDFRTQLLGMIDQKGIEKSQMHVLQGLTKLRQICDSPAILNEAEQFPEASVKIEELMREITENVGNHKALVFSQFLGMLALIRKALEAENIPYVYFDGSTSTAGREKAVQDFQHNDECRVFLISLKAGGIGLNLTAADYVYIVDPWWNPAVEQQAIDRTHRIGQTKAVFAYRLVCRDTIEEKMLLLQDRKRALAADLVSDDSAIIKRLTRDDVAYLLS